MPITEAMTIWIPVAVAPLLVVGGLAVATLRALGAQLSELTFER